MTISPIRDTNGSLIGFSGIIRDITERKALEEQLRQTAKLESIGILAGGIAHDFNNLLVPILGNASFATNILPPDSPVRPMLNDVVSASQRAAHLTRQLLAYSGRGKFVIQAVDLSLLTLDIQGLIQTSIPRTVELKLDLPAGLPSLVADVAQVQQLIMNLVINAAEAVGDAPGTVTITTGVQEIDDQYINANPIAPGRYVFLEVRDTGSGMDEETIRKIFDPFFTTKFEGRGLGLAAVLGIVRGHKGSISVESNPGLGSIFKVLFPAAEEMAEPSEEREVSPEFAGSGVILVVDDEEGVRHTAAAVLKGRGYSILEASNGQEAIEIFQQHSSQIALVLLDLSMPIMSGEDCLRQLKQIKPDLLVLLSSGFSESEATHRFQASGIKDFLQKPYTAAHLIELVRSVLAGIA
jgi:nitrogen-specific signal transduction histidine kinase/CheY-like chemotaxis protein